MKKAILTLILTSVISASAAIVVPSANGTDGALNITADTVIDLSLAPTGAWDNDNTANAGKGVYDASKWAVVFKYTSVTIAAGKTVTFKNHVSRAPVVWLVGSTVPGVGVGNVTIDGTVKLDGESANAVAPPKLAGPGPGGFRGGSSNYSGVNMRGSGFGFGGSLPGVNTYGHAGNASFGTVGQGGAAVYGNPSLVPLIGGSGAGGGLDEARVGGAGGGAILIAATGQCSVSGMLSANGGSMSYNGGYNDSGAGSGGGIRLICDSFSGTGSLAASGGGNTDGTISGHGRIRLERVTNTNTISVFPAPSVVDLAAGTTALLWPPAGAPEVKIISLGGVNAPADPKSGFGTIGADVSLPTATTTACVIETTNVEVGAQVKVRITPRDTYNFTEVDATATTINLPVIRWTATLPTNLGYSAVQVKVIRP